MTHGFLFVVDCPWNRVHSPELIGKRIDPLHPPSYTAVKYERELMDELTNDDDSTTLLDTRLCGVKTINLNRSQRTCQNSKLMT